MNLFYLDKDIDKCAEAHFDQHVTKMQLEITQMLCTNIWIDEVLGYTPRKVNSDETTELRSACKNAGLSKSVRYKPCFFNHPCTIWMRETYENHEYSVLLVDALDQEAQYRGFNAHKSAKVARQLPLPRFLPAKGFRQPYQAVTDECKRDSSIEAYREYYKRDKVHLAKWTKRDPPQWWWRRSDENYKIAKGFLERARTEDNISIWRNQVDEIIRIGV